MVRSDCLAIIPDRQSSSWLVDWFAYSIVFRDSTLGNNGRSFNHDTSPSSHSHRSEVNKVVVGSMSIIGGVYLRQPHLSMVCRDSHMHMGDTHALFGNVTPRIVIGSKSLAGLAFWGNLSLGNKDPIA